MESTKKIPKGQIEDFASEAVKLLLALKADDDKVVKITTDQNIDDVKSFLKDIFIAGLTIGRGKGNIASNTVFGTSVFDSNEVGLENTIIGFEAGKLLKSNRNTFTGNKAGKAMTTGFRNSFYGNEVALLLAIGDHNAIFGNQAFVFGTSGSFNAIFGGSAGNAKYGGGAGNVTKLTNCVLIGFGIQVLADDSINEIVIGAYAAGNGSNTATIGNNAIIKTFLQGVVNYNKSYTVGTLPVGKIGDTTYVTDALSPTYLGTLTGGGTVVCPVFHNGTTWVCR